MDDVGQAEYATLGSLLLAPAGLDGVAPWLAPGDFRDPLGREVYGPTLGHAGKVGGDRPGQG